jgi:histidinol phosphatase-like PHP family hydrolase
MDRGHHYLGTTDHSYGLRIAGGITMEDVARQREEIDRVNASLSGSFRVLQGIEANIRADGSVDMEAHEMGVLDYVVVAPHSQLRKADDQTERMRRAVRTPGVHILAHPRGRMLTRQGVLADWDRVFEEAARARVAIELDGDPWRQDLDWKLARRALAAGCLFALDSDAHSVDELRYSDWALAHARLAGIPPERVINTWPLVDLEEWIAERRTPETKSAGRWPGAFRPAL